MAKKKKTAKAGKKGAGKLPPFAPFPPPACDAPIWRHFWTLMAAGLALRLLAALSSDWTYRGDEIMQYLEQAHRFVFGAGFMPWEIRLGARNMLLAAPAAGVMALCKSAGGGPDCYIPAIEIFYAAVSLAIPASLYFIGRRIYDETAGRVALAMGCLWYEFIVFAPRMMSEQTATIFILAGLACVPSIGGGRAPERPNTHAGAGAPARGEESPDAGRTGVRMFLAGFCLGLGGLLRLPYIPIAGLLGLLVLSRVPLRSAPFVLGGAAAALMAAGGADLAAWGGFYHSAFAYLEAASITNRFRDVHQTLPVASWHGPIVKLAICSAGLWPLALAAAAADWRRHWLALSITVALLTVHAVADSYAYSHVFLALPTLSLVLGGVASRPPEFLRGALRGTGKKAAACVLAGVSLLGGAHALPGLSASFWWDFKHPRFFFYAHPAASAGRFLSRVPPEKMRAALWTAVDPIWTGGYYYFHHPVPYWHEGLAPHREALAGLPLSEAASHIAAPEPQGAQRALAAGFREVANFGGVRIFENPEWEKVRPVDEFPLSMGHRDDIGLDRAFEKAGKTPPPPEFLPR